MTPAALQETAPSPVATTPKTTDVDVTRFWNDRTTSRTIMAIGAHADDLELQAGGTLAKYRAWGYGIHYVMATNNMSGQWATILPDGTQVSRDSPWYEMMPQRRRETLAAARFYGTEPIWLDYPQGHYNDGKGRCVHLVYGSERPEAVPEGMPSILTAHRDPAAVERVLRLILDRQPEAVLTHGGSMANEEHFATQVLVGKAYWQARQAGYEGMLLHWHDLGGERYGHVGPRWDTFVDITDYWEQKMAATAFHACQKPDPTRLDWPQWGATCGCGQAEVFTIVGRCPRPLQPADFTLEILRNERR